MNTPSLVILAAGVGSRYGGLKQIDPVGPNGEVIMDYSIYDAARSGFGNVVMVVSSALENAFRERYSNSAGKYIKVDYVVQELTNVPEGCVVPTNRTKPWGTGHALLCCKNAVRGPLAVINADDFYGPGAFKALADCLRGAEDEKRVYEYCMVGYRLANTLSPTGPVSRGICEVDSEGYLLDVRERTGIEKYNHGVAYTDEKGQQVQLDPNAVVSMNAWGFTPSIFSELESRFRLFLNSCSLNLEKAEFYLPDVVGDLVKEGKARVKVLHTEERWFGMTYREDRLLVEAAVAEMIARGVYPSPLWN
ncbi:MAG: nucleotidyltransferase [Armatimonadota bacterium]|nr:nucleotidyltransferase [Armatimonadota bacterium]